MKNLETDRKTDLLRPEHDLWKCKAADKYLLNISRDPKFLLPLSQYPKEIELEGQWHRRLNKMRGDSRDGDERGELFGSVDGNVFFYLPLKGNNHEVFIEEAIDELRQNGKFDVSKIIGLIHSHPNNLRERILRGGKKQALSLFDLYLLIREGGIVRVMALAEKDKNLFMLCSAETKTDEKNYNQFFDFWWDEMLGRNGDDLTNKKKRKTLPSFFDFNIAISAYYKLVLYVGKPNGALKKIAPA